MSGPFTLLLHLEGPMQSWGYRSRFDYRDTALEPTRSGVIGLICAAMGIARGEDISRFDPIRMGVLVLVQGRPERDYHTALNVVTADGSTTGTVLSYRDYLSDASFVVALEADDLQLLTEIAAGLRRPVWPLCLGRRSFPLARPPLDAQESPQPGTRESRLAAIPGGVRMVLESEDGEAIQVDWPECFGERRFRPRRLAHRPLVIDPADRPEEEPCTSPA